MDLSPGSTVHVAAIKPGLVCDHVGHPPSKTSVNVLSWTCPSQGLVGKATITGGSLHLGRSEVLRRSRYYLRAQSQRHHTIDRLEKRGGHKVKDITPSIAWRTEAGTKSRTSHHRSLGGPRRAQSQRHHTIDRLESRTSHHRSPGGERRAQSQGHHTIDRLEERGGHKVKDITPSIAWRTEVGTKSRTSHHRSPGGERPAQSQGHHTIDRLEERGGHKVKDITPSIAWRTEAGTKSRTSHHRSPGGQRRAQSQGHHTIDRLEERGVERGNARRSS